MSYALGATLDPKFVEQITAGHSALSQLKAMATAVKLASTDPGIAEAARLAVDFAAVKGPALLNEALAKGDAARLARVQGATQSIIKALKPEVIPALVQRFMVMVIVPGAGAFLSADTINEAKEMGRDAIESALPDTLKDKRAAEEFAFQIKLAIGLTLGILALGTIGYTVRAFK